MAGIHEPKRRRIGGMLPVLIAVSAVVSGAAQGVNPESVEPGAALHLEFPHDFDRAALEAALHPEHPRLIATAAGWARVRESMESSRELQAVVALIERSAAAILEEPPREREMVGRRLLSTSREVLRRVLTTAAMYRLTGEERYMERAREELLNAAGFVDWNPSHFLDTAEMTLAVAIGYDWLHDALTEGEAAILREAIVEKGLNPGRGPHGFKRTDNNWNPVCFAGLVAGALAVADHEPDLAVEFVREAMANNPRALEAYRPDGAYPEGPSYWSYGTHFQVILVSLLETAFGTSWEMDTYPGFQESAVYINAMVGSTGLYFNYADGGAGVGALPALHWFAARGGNPALDARERERLLASAVPEGERSTWRLLRNRFFPLTLFWMEPGLAEREPGSSLPLHWRGGGSNPVAVHRTSWEDESLFFAIKGGSPSVNHGHMDIGSFVLDANGVRWAIDLGAQSYESLERLDMGIWDRRQESDRWRVFRLNTRSHNTLVIDEGHQLVAGSAPIVSFSEDPGSAHTVVDMTGVYADVLDRAVRGARFFPGEAVLLHDELSGLNEGQRVRWAMMTRAEIELAGERAVLRQEGRSLYARIVTPSDAEFETVQTEPPPNEWDASNPGTRMLAFFVEGAGDGASRDLRVVLSPEELTDERIEQLRKREVPTKW